MKILTPSPSRGFWRALVLCLLWRCLLGPLNVTQKSPVLSKFQVTVFELFWETDNADFDSLMNPIWSTEWSNHCFLDWIFKVIGITIAFSFRNIDGKSKKRHRILVLSVTVWWLIKSRLLREFAWHLGSPKGTFIESIKRELSKTSPKEKGSKSTFCVSAFISACYNLLRRGLQF